MARLKIGLLAPLAALGLSAAPAQAFGHMMMGGHQHGGDAGHKDSTVGHAGALLAPAPTKQDEPADKERSSSNPSTAPQHAVSSDADRTDAEHGR